MSELLPEDLRLRLPPIGAQGEASPWEVVIHLRYTDPASGWEWYVMEGQETGDPEEGNEDVMLFGYVKGYAEEYGTFMLSDLKGWHRHGVPANRGQVLRDEQFELGPLPLVAARYGLSPALGENR